MPDTVCRPAIPRRAAALLALLALSAAFAHAPLRSAIAQPAEMSPDEAALQLRPYVLTNDTAPAGYSISGPTAWTPASLAFYNADEQGVSPMASLDKYESDGWIIEFTQTIYRDATASGPSTAFFYAVLMRNADDARDVVNATKWPFTSEWSSIQAVPGGAGVGDASQLYRLVRSSGELDDIRWSRGQIAYSLFVSGGPSTAPLVDLAVSVDTIETNNPPIDLSVPTLTPPGDETARLQSLLRMSTITIAPPVIPAGSRSTGPDIYTVAGELVDTPDPQPLLSLVDGKWERLIYLSQTYNAPSGANFSFSFTEDASADAQTIDFRDFSDQAQVPILEPSPLALGDDAYLHRNHGLDAAGVTRDYVTIHWRHGALALAAEISGKPGSFTDADVAAFAQAVDDAYQQSAYITN